MYVHRLITLKYYKSKNLGYYYHARSDNYNAITYYDTQKDNLNMLYYGHCCNPIPSDILNPPLLRLTSTKPLWLDLQPVDIKSRWRHNWKSAQVVNSYLVCDPTIRQPGFDLPRQQCSLLNRFRTEQGHCGACRRTWRLTDTDLCPCGETQMMSHIVESSPDKTEWRLIMATLCG